MGGDGTVDEPGLAWPSGGSRRTLRHSWSWLRARWQVKARLPWPASAEAATQVNLAGLNPGWPADATPSDIDLLFNFSLISSIPLFL